MRNRFTTIYLRLMKYAMFMGIIGGIASFIGPPHHGLVKTCIGVMVGATLLGSRLPTALKGLHDITDEISDEIFQQ